MERGGEKYKRVGAVGGRSTVEKLGILEINGHSKLTAAEQRKGAEGTCGDIALQPCTQPHFHSNYRSVPVRNTNWLQRYN